MLVSSSPARLLKTEVAQSNCSRGGIGRRVRLRTVWGDPWRFESSREHHPLTQMSQAAAGRIADPGRLWKVWGGVCCSPLRSAEHLHLELHSVFASAVVERVVEMKRPRACPCNTTSQ